MSQTTKKSTGKVVSSKMQGIITVEVARQKMHPLYQKSIKWTKKYHVRNSHSAQTGDTVEFVETRPISKTVRWATTRIIESKIKSPAPAENSPAKLSKRSSKSGPKPKTTKTTKTTKTRT